MFKGEDLNFSPQNYKLMRNSEQSHSLFALPQPILRFLGVRPRACKPACTVEQTGGYNFYIQEKINKIPACQTRRTTPHFMRLCKNVQAYNVFRMCHAKQEVQRLRDEQHQLRHVNKNLMTKVEALSRCGIIKHFQRLDNNIDSVRRIILLFTIIKIFHKFKIFEYLRI